MSYEKSALQESLIPSDSGSKILEESLLDQISHLKNYVLDLENFHSKLGTDDDTTLMRSQMNDKIAKGNSTIMQISSLLERFDSQMYRKEEREYCEKITRASHSSFQLYKERYTQALREIHQRKTEFTPKESLVEDYVPEVKIHIGDLSSYQPVEEAQRHSEDLRRSTRASMLDDIEEFKLGEENTKKSGKRVNDIDILSDTTRDFSVRYEKGERAKGKKKGKSGSQNKKILIVSILILLIIGVLVFLYESGPYRI